MIREILLGVLFVNGAIFWIACLYVENKLKRTYLCGIFYFAAVALSAGIEHLK